MGLNVVINNQPGQAAAVQVYQIPAALEEQRVAPPPGSIGGNPTTNITSQLERGNPGGVAATSGLGITTDNIA
jgi:hypothetical protein